MRKMINTYALKFSIKILILIESFKFDLVSFYKKHEKLLKKL